MVDELYAQQTWFDLVRKHWPGINDDEADLVLWNATCFPFGTVDQVTSNIIEMHARSGGDPREAVNLAVADITRELAALTAREAESSTPAP